MFQVNGILYNAAILTYEIIRKYSCQSYFMYKTYFHIWSKY